MPLAGLPLVGNDAAMQPHPHRSGRKWRRFVRHSRGFFFAGFLGLVIAGVVFLLFWFLSSPRFVK
jgi:hypothetical protein